MRIFNGTNKAMDIPLSGIQRLQIGPHSVSPDFMPNNEFLALMVSSYDYSELALIVSGPYEINMCSTVSGSVGFVVQSLEEAIERFSPQNAKPEPTKLEIIEEVAPKAPEEIKEEVKEEQEEAIENAPEIEVKEEPSVEETVVEISPEESTNPNPEVVEETGEEETTESGSEEKPKTYVSNANKKKNKKKH